MSYQTSAEAFHGKTPVVLVTFIVDSITYRWSTHDVATPDGMYEGRIVDAGSIDREVVSGRPAGADINIVLSNHDGALDALVSDFETTSYVKGSAVIKRGFLDLAYASYETKATLDITSIAGYRDSRHVEIGLGNEHKFLTGTLEPPTVDQVLAALKTADPTNFDDAKINPAAKGLTVPIVIGNSFGLLRASGWLNAAVSTTPFIGDVGTLTTTSAPVLFGAVSKYGFYIYEGLAQYNGAVYMVNGKVVSHSADQAGGEDAFMNTFAAQDKVITLNGETWHVLLLRAERFVEYMPGKDEDGPIELRVRPQAKFTGISTPRPWTIPETVQGIFESATGSQGTWSANSVAADWATFTQASDIVTRYVISNQIDVMAAMGTVFKESFVDAYVTADGKLSVTNIVSTPGPSPDYSNTLLFSEEENITTLSVSFPPPGSKWGIATRAIVGWSDTPGTVGDGVLILEDKTGRQYIFGSFSNEGRTEAAANFDAETAMGRDITVQLGGFTIPGKDSAREVGERCIAVRAIPRPIIRLNATIGATQVELGDFVRVKHSAAPWSGEHVGVVYGIADNLGDHTVQLTVIDLDEYLNRKTFIYDTRAQWVHADTISPNLGATISITNGSNTVTASAVDTFDGVLAGDILRIDEGSNRFEVIIVSTDQDDTLTTSNVGSGEGPLSSTYTTASGIIAWSILRSQATRGTTPAKSGTPIEDGFGAYADDADDLFLDNVTTPYTYI